MKCTPMRLLHRSELDKRKTERGFQIIREPAFSSEENSWYPLTPTRRSSPPTPNSPKLSVKNLEFPNNSASYNSGNSLEKWSKKRPKLRSNRSARPKPPASDIEDDDACDISNIISNLDAEAEEVVEEEEYEVNSDIEQLLRESQEFEEQEKQTRRKSGNGKKKRKKLKKTITFSFSKPASPETKKVIRVDVTSSVSLDELRYLQTQKEIDDELSNRFEGVLNNNESNECVVKCSQLVLAPKR